MKLETIDDKKLGLYLRDDFNVRDQYAKKPQEQLSILDKLSGCWIEV